MANYDYMIIGGGITGSALAYELARHGLKVLLLEKNSILDNATVYSYGGLAYWSGATDSIRFLYQDSLHIYESLTHELSSDIEFRILDLLLTIDPDDDIEAIKNINRKFEIQPELIDVNTACEMEPLLNPHAIAGAFKQEHGHIHPRKTNEAYQSAFIRLGGEIKIERVIELIRDKDEIKGVRTLENKYYGSGVIVCAGGLSRKLLQEAGIETKLYFTHSQILAIPPTEIKMRSMVMPAVIKRLQAEQGIYNGEDESIWNTASGEIVNSVTESGAIQFLDGSIYVGQSSEIMTDPSGAIDLPYYENQLRKGIRNILPPLAHLEGKVRNCLVAFSDPNDPLIGPIPGLQGIHLFNGFTSTLIVTPSLARHFANYLAGNQDEVMDQLLY